MGDQRVVGVAEQLLVLRVPRAVLHALTSFLRVLDADAELERLRRHRHAAARRAFDTCRGRCGRSRARPPTSGMKPDDVATPFSPAVVEVQVLDPREEAHLAAELLDLAADRLDDGRQAVAAEVRAVVVEDARLARLLALALGEQLQHAQHVRPGAAAGQLAVGEGAGPALAEEVVALGVERPAVVEASSRRGCGRSPACRVRARAGGSRAAPGSTRTRARRARSRRRRGGAAGDRARVGHGERRLVVQLDLRAACGSARERSTTTVARRPGDRPRSCRRTGVAACRGGRAPCGRCASGRGRPASTPSARARCAGRFASGSSTGSRRFETRRDMRGIITKPRGRLSRGFDAVSAR